MGPPQSGPIWSQLKLISSTATLSCVEPDRGRLGVEARDRQISVEAAKHYNYFRDYDPAIGRYLEPDPLGVLLARSPGLQERLNNMFGYVNGNPVRFVDYRGLCACKGGTWDQEFGDFGFQVALGGYFSGGNVNLSCKSNPDLKCSAKQVCIGGGPTPVPVLAGRLAAELTEHPTAAISSAGATGKYRSAWDRFRYRAMAMEARRPAAPISDGLRAERLSAARHTT